MVPPPHPDPSAQSDYDWTTADGIKRLDKLLAAKVPYDPAPFQVEDTARLLTGKHVLCITATGDGKSALFYMYALARPDTMTIVVSPTNALEHDMVKKLAKVGLSAVAINKDALDAAAVLCGTQSDVPARNLWQEAEAGNYSVVLLSPEMLQSARFKAFADSSIVRSRLKLFCVDECHLIDEWGSDFRVAYKNIAACLPWLPKGITRLGLTATLEPGRQTDTIMKALGTRPDTIYLDRRDCERRNISVVVRPIQYAYTTGEFRDLDWLIKIGIDSAADITKTIIYCETIELGHKVAKYLRSLLPLALQSQGKTIIRHVHSMICDDCKVESSDALYESGPERKTSIFVATDVLGVGIDVQDCDCVICFPTPSSLASGIQHIGRTSRGRDRAGTAYIYIKKSDIEAVSAYLHSGDLDSRLLPQVSHGFVNAGLPVGNTTISKKVPVKVAARIRSDVFIKNLSLWLVIAAFIRGTCIVRQINVIYQNPRVNMNCGRCSSCCVFPLPDPRPRSQPPLLTMANTAPTAVASDRGLPALPGYKKLTSADVESVTGSLERAVKHLRLNARYNPDDLFFGSRTFLPRSYIKQITDNFLSITSKEVLQMRLSGWDHWDEFGEPLWEIVAKLVTETDKRLEARHQDVTAQRRNAARRQREEVQQVRTELAAAGLSNVKRVTLRVPPPRPSTPPSLVASKENISTPYSTPHRSPASKANALFGNLGSSPSLMTLSPRRHKRPLEDQDSPSRRRVIRRRE